MLASPRDPVRTVVPAALLLIVLGVVTYIALTPGTAATLPEQPPVDAGATAWMLTSTALVLLMVPGLAMFYGGLVRTKNVLGTMMHSFAAMAIIGVLWVVIGYALAFGPNVLGGWVGFDPGLLFLRSIDTTVSTGGIPDLVFAMFQGKFAIITPALIAGAFAERVKFRGYAIFIAAWSLLVYSPLAHWVWAADGFLFTMGAIDFAGGTVVHISAGISGLVAALYLGARRGYPRIAMHPNNLVMVMMGVGLLWVGWFGFNAGSSLSSGVKTAQALTVTQVAAAAGALAWVCIEAVQHRKATSLGMASGILAGLVVITPAAGVVQPAGAVVLGFVASALCYGAILLKNRLGYDDTLDVFGIHGIAGMAGAILLTFFIRAGEIPQERDMLGQLPVQLLGVALTVGYAAIVTIVLLVIVQKVFGLRLGTTAEGAGMDHELHGEQGYGLLNLN
ncbi:MAG TPA: ammonium transporter [Candidatus Limnocylindrales bacterium]|nr:ammonium transporter [Candidatus Limnocylindrales bacterium]